MVEDRDLCFTRLLPQEQVEAALERRQVRYRQRLYTPLLTIWTFLYQVLASDPSCRAAVARFLAFLCVCGEDSRSAKTDPYCKARQRLPEELLAERVVGLSWRLRRAERLQNAAFAALDEGEPTPLLEARHEEWKQLKGNEWDRGLSGLFDGDAGLGPVVVEDFGGARVLDRLLMYERRIESSLYRMMGQLRREREAHAAAAEPEGVSRSEGGLVAGRESVAPVKLGSFGGNVVPEVQMRKTALGSSEPLVGAARGMGILPVGGNHGRDAHATETPCGVIMDPPAAGNRGQDAHATGTLHVGQSHGRDARATGMPCGVATSDAVSGRNASRFTLHASRSILRNEPNFGTKAGLPGVERSSGGRDMPDILGVDV
jgi:hypothetical protein